ncbi:hypothetical protein E4021_15290 [Neolewinella litorea]|uniref:Protein-tyrosine-phosphatase n=2 Tax=Neolewinella litorea TaxID=2562452 RepID=A0A4S4NAS9_9BACT|nr:hypothetical protein E4021_15290 [Neolewinella litorea]
MAADFYGIPNVETYSGGTEATAFHPNAVAALRRAGLETDREDAEGQNPIYRVRWREDMSPYRAFSKVWNAAPNPRKDFAAVMVCSEADAACPVVAGCDLRVALPFEDPKASDGTPREAAAYDASVQEIGREMLYVMHRAGQG